MQVRKLLNRHKSDLALVIGNGVNRFGAADQTNSWDGLLLDLAKKHHVHGDGAIPDGIALTEFYDLLELKKPSPTTPATSYQEEFCLGMSEWRPYPHHVAIVQWARTNAVPVLTTNFDDVFARAGTCKLLPVRAPTFTDFYPWERYYGDGLLGGPDRGFGIWHVNGMSKYRRSVRLGLTHYMGSVERARGWLHKGQERRLFSGKNVHGWDGANTWLHIIFNKPLLIFGLALEENEVLLRWLLIERARYFRKFPERRRAGWYAYASENQRPGKLYFLEGIGITPVRVDSYRDLYGEATWK